MNDDNLIRIATYLSKKQLNRTGVRTEYRDRLNELVNTAILAYLEKGKLETVHDIFRIMSTAIRDYTRKEIIRPSKRIRYLADYSREWLADKNNPLSVLEMLNRETTIERIETAMLNITFPTCEKQALKEVFNNNHPKGRSFVQGFTRAKQRIRKALGIIIIKRFGGVQGGHLYAFGVD